MDTCGVTSDGLPIPAHCLTTTVWKGGNNSPVKQQVHCSRGRDNTTRTDTAGLCNSAARDGWGYLPMSIPRRCVCQI